jgi:hypothetical protein
MSEKPLSYNKQFQKERPAIRTLATRFMGETLCAQLEPFLQYIEENKMPLSIFQCNTYQSSFKGKSVFRIEIANGQACMKDIYAVKVYTADNPCHYREENRLVVQDSIEQYLTSLENDMKDYFLNHLPRCRGCGKCKPGVNLEFFGQTYKTICACDMFTMRVNNPSEADYVMIQKFIDARKHFILQTTQKK